MPGKPKQLDTTSSRLRDRATLSSKRGPKNDARRSDKSITEALRAILNSRPDEQVRSTTVAELIAVRLVARALDGDIQAFREIADRTEERVPQAHAPEPEDREIKVNIEYVGGKEAFEQVRREFEQANPNYKTLLPARPRSQLVIPPIKPGYPDRN